MGGNGSFRGRAVPSATPGKKLASDGEEIGKLFAELGPAPIPQATRAWLEQNRALLTKRGVVDAFFEKWFEIDPTAAVEYMRAHSDDPGFASARAAVILRTFRRGTEEALNFVASLPDDARPGAARDLVTTAGEDSAALGRIAAWGGRAPKQGYLHRRCCSGRLERVRR